jgi:hypothetical protein
VQVDNLRHRCEHQEVELHKSAKKVQEAMTLVAEESAKSKAAKEVIKSLTAQVLTNSPVFTSITTILKPCHGHLGIFPFYMLAKVIRVGYLCFIIKSC